MLKLCGFALSNYHNKVKLALLEKGLPFEEVLTPYVRGDELLAKSPMGKVPFLETEHGALCESQPILEYIEARWPTPPLLPADPWAAAKVRELTQYLDLHLELTVRQLYPQAYFGATLSDKFIARVRPDIEKAIAAFKRLAVFSPYVAGPQFTMADCSAFCHLPLVGLTTKLIYGEDLLAGAGVDWKAYVKRVEAQHPHAQKVAADRKADQLRALAAFQARLSGES